MFLICCWDKGKGYLKSLELAFEGGGIGPKALACFVEVVSSVLHFYNS
jgi:hypothetical protein